MDGVGDASLEPLPRLRADGLLADFITMVKSVRAIPADHTNVSAASTARPTTTATPTTVEDLGPYYSDSGYRSSPPHTWRETDTYYQAPPRIYQLLEYEKYDDWQTYGNPYLYRTNVGDGDPQVLCQQGGGYYEHPIAKPGVNGIVQDNFYPNKYVTRLTTSTYHTMYFAANHANICKYYRPYTQ